LPMRWFWPRFPFLLGTCFHRLWRQYHSTINFSWSYFWLR
jgi:hypothetical protein